MSEHSDITDEPPHLTVVALFEDSIDADQTLSDFRKRDIPPETVSIVVQDAHQSTSRHVRDAPDITTALGVAGLDQAGGWLTHLVSIIIRGDGAVLAAGPLGALLPLTESDGEHSQTSAHNDDPGPGEDVGSVQQAMTRFGFELDEATYIARRIIAGSILIGITTEDEQEATEAHRLFAERNAVHIGANWTPAAVAGRAQQLVHTPVESVSPENVVVLDSAGVLVGLCSRENGACLPAGCDATVLGADGEAVGTIEDLLAEVPAEVNGNGEDVQIRYAVLAFDRWMGIGRIRVAVPAEYLTLDHNPIVIELDRELLRKAPVFNADRPFGRREEELICSYFGCQRYWLREA